MSAEWMSHCVIKISDEEIARARRDITERLKDGRLIPEPDGPYSFPCVLGGLWTGGMPEIVGYFPTKVPQP